MAGRGGERIGYTSGRKSRQFYMGVDWTGTVWHGVERKGYIIGVQLPNSLQGQGEARLDLAWRGEARRGQATSSGCNSPTVSMAWLGADWTGTVWHGPHWRGRAWTGYIIAPSGATVYLN